MEAIHEVGPESKYRDQRCIALVVLALLLAVPTFASAEDATVLTPNIQKIRTIITTDGEIDDQCSLVRYMLYANEFVVNPTGSGSMPTPRCIPICPSTRNILPWNTIP